MLLDWYRPIAELPRVKAFGVTCVIGFEQGGVQVLATRAQYRAACKLYDMNYIFQLPTMEEDWTAEANDPLCLGFDLKDEPNAGPPSTVPINQLEAAYNLCKSKAPNKIVMLNYDGWPEEAWGTFDYHVASKFADWLMFDYYVRNREGPASDIRIVMQAKINRFKAYQARPDQKFGFFLETSYQDLPKQYAPLGCGPTPVDIQAYFDIAKANQIDLIGLFEDVIGTNFESYTGTPAEIVSVIQKNVAVAKQRTPYAVVINKSGVNVICDDQSVTTIKT